MMPLVMKKSCPIWQNDINPSRLNKIHILSSWYIHFQYQINSVHNLKQRSTTIIMGTLLNKRCSIQLEKSTEYSTGRQQNYNY